MNVAEVLDELSEVAELNRLNCIVQDGQEGQLLIAAGLMVLADSLDELTTAFKYSGAATPHRSIGESLDIIAESITSIDVKG